MCGVRSYRDKQQMCSVHRFVWECFNGEIPKGQIISHINNNKEDNRLCNLELATHKEKARSVDYSFNITSRNNNKCIKATNRKTEEILFFL